MRKDNAQFVAVLLAVAFPVAIWIGADYLTHTQADAPGAATSDRPVDSQGTASAPPTSALASMPSVSGPEGLTKDAVAPGQPATGSNVVHKCRENGRIVYSDLPCGSGTSLKTFTPRLAAAPANWASRSPTPSRPTADPQSGPVAPPTRQVAAADSVKSEKVQRQAECGWIDKQVAAIDARMRQPYYPAEGDRLKEERKALYDRRFSLGC